jgi:hypothetical protein
MVVLPSMASSSGPGSLASKLLWGRTRPASSPPHKAKTTARKSQVALQRWAKDNGWYPPVFLDAPSGNPRTGIVDAVLVRVSRDDPDVLELRLVQLKSGLAGLKASECERLEQAVKCIEVGSMYALCSGTHVTTMVKPSVWALNAPRRGSP